MLGQTIDTARSWGSPLNRLAFGILALYAFSTIEELPVAESLRLLIAVEMAVSSLPQILLLFVLAMILGAVCVTVGSLFSGSKAFSDKAQTRRAYRVGLTDNSLLAKRLSDGQMKFEFAAGLMGLLIFVISTVIAYRLATWTFIEFSPAGKVPSGFGPIGGLIAGFMASFAVSWSSKETILSIDELLDEIDQQKETVLS